MSLYGGYEAQPFVADFYDSLPGHVQRPDIAFFMEQSRACGGRTLEMGCGTGRVLVPTAVAGCDVTGLDLSKHMLAQCLLKLRDQPADVRRRVRIVQGNMISFDLQETYRLITTPFRAFQHLVSVTDQMSCLGSAYRHLEPGGRLILDLFHPRPDRLFNPIYQEEQETCPEMQLPDGRTLRVTNRTAASHRGHQVVDTEIIYYATHPDGRQERLVQAFPLRCFYRFEVEHLLARMGFRTADVYGDYAGAPFLDESAEMIFVAEKRA